MRQINFKEQEKAAAQEYRQNANAVAVRLKERVKRVTAQVRLSVSNIRQLKIRAIEEGKTMSHLLDEIVREFFRTHK